MDGPVPPATTQSGGFDMRDGARIDAEHVAGRDQHFNGDAAGRDLYRINQGLSAADLAVLSNAVDGALRRVLDAERDRDDGVNERLVIALARRISPDEQLDFPQALKELETVVALAREHRSRPGDAEDGYVDDVLARVEASTEAGKLDASAATLDTGLADLADKHRRACRALLEKAESVDTLRRDAAGVAKRIEALIGLDDPGGRAPWKPAFRARFESVFAEACTKGVTFSLTVATEMARRMVATAHPGSETGEALTRLSQVYSETGYQGPLHWLHGAVVAGRAGIDALDPTSHAWAYAQQRLGFALRELGSRSRAREPLLEAESAYLAAETVLTREADPGGWAAGRVGLANVRESLGTQTREAALIRQAIADYRQALEVQRPGTAPLDWTPTQGSLGTALATLGEIERSRDIMEEAIECLQETLLATPRSDYPLEWARTQNNLGDTQWHLAELLLDEGGTAPGLKRLRQAAAAFAAALEVYTPENSLICWVSSYGTLGVVESSLADRTHDGDLAARAVDRLTMAIEAAHRSGHSLYAAACEEYLPRAQAVLARLSV